MDYVKVRHIVEGKERIEKGPKFNGLQRNGMEINGNHRLFWNVIVGPQLLFLGPYEQVVERSQGLSLGSTEYALVKDLLSGERRVIKGPCMSGS